MYTLTVPAVGPDLGQLFGVIIFNYTFTITVPAWLNEKKSHVSINRTIWASTTLCTLLYIIFGLFGALAFSYPPADMLSMLASTNSDALTRVSAALFG